MSAAPSALSRSLNLPWATPKKVSRWSSVARIEKPTASARRRAKEGSSMRNFASRLRITQAPAKLISAARCGFATTFRRTRATLDSRGNRPIGSHDSLTIWNRAECFVKMASVKEISARDIAGEAALLREAGFDPAATAADAIAKLEALRGAAGVSDAAIVRALATIATAESAAMLLRMETHAAGALRREIRRALFKLRQ